MAKRPAGPGSPSLGIEIARKSAWLISQEGSDLVLAFLFSWIAIRRLGPEVFGLLSLVQAVLNLTNLGTYNFEFSLIRLIPLYRRRDQPGGSRRLIGISLAIKAVLALAASFSLYLLAPAAAAFYGQPDLQLALRFGSISVIAAAVAEVGAAASLGLLHPEVRTIMTAVRRSVEVLGLLGVTAAGLGLPHVVLVLAAADTVAATGYTLAVGRLTRRELQSGGQVAVGELLRRGFRYSTPLMGARITEIGGRELGKLVIARLAPPAVLGYYAVARLAADRLMNLLSQSPLASVPVYSRYRELPAAEAKTDLEKTYLQLFTYQVVIGGILALAVWAGAPFIVRILGGEAFLPTVVVLRALTPAILLWSAIATIHGLSLVNEKTALILGMNLSQTILAVASYAFLVPRWQATGAALADDLGTAAAFFVSLLLIQISMGIQSGVFARRFIQLSLPVPILILPLVWIPDQLGPLAIWFSGALFAYATYLMAVSVFTPDSWDRLAALAENSTHGYSSFSWFVRTGARYHQFVSDIIATKGKFKS